VETVPPAQRDAFRADLLSARAASANAVGPQRTKSKDKTWATWEDFCASVEVDPLLNEVPDPIIFFQAFGQRVRDGRLSASGNPVRSRTVEDAWRKVGQKMAELGSIDHRNVRDTNRLTYRLAQQLRGYSRDDDPTTRVKPVPLAIVRHPWSTATTPKEHAIADMAIIGFFFLCRPGEFVETTHENQSRPFRLGDVQLLIDRRWYKGHSVPLETMAAARSATLCYHNQKNGIRGQGITMGATGHPHICPVRTLARRIQHLREHNAPPDTPIYSFWDASVGVGRQEVFNVHVTLALRLAAAVLFPVLGIEARDISCRSLRPGGATAMLCAGIDRDVTQLVGRWRSDEMLKYLHVQADSIMHNYSRQMFEQGHFSYHHDDDVGNSDTFRPPPASRTNNYNNKKPTHHPEP
jgi:hypothetical protein